MRFFIGSLFLGVAALAADFDWHSIAPSTNISYQPCYTNFQCARLLLPLDWKDSTNNATVSIAIIKQSAAVSQDDAKYGGPIFINPGGPGGSGVATVLGAGKRLQSIVDTPNQRYFDIVGFDPRGIANSEPQMNCYPGNNLGRQALTLRLIGSGSLDTSPQSVSYQYSAAKAQGKRCEDKVKDLMPFVNTPSVARDLLAMVDKAEELRRYETKFNSTEIPRLQYLGISYGTAIGQYFVALFPGRVGRLALDGIVDIVDYTSGRGWLKNTLDADEVFSIFLRGCFNAGSAICKLRQQQDSSAADIEHRVWSWIGSLDDEPIIATTADGSGDISWRSGDVRAFISATLYKADYKALPLSGLLSDAMMGNTTGLTAQLLGLSGITKLQDGCRNLTNKDIGVMNLMAEPRSSVLCTDGDDVSDKDASYWRSYVQDQVEISKIFGGFWSLIRISCAGWKIRPNWSFKGPFTSPRPSKNASCPEPDRPAAPLLFISSRNDPVTPLRGARAMAKNHPGAGLAILNASGHSAPSSGDSGCLSQIIREYFDKGIVPAKEAVCNSSVNPWKQAKASGSGSAEIMSSLAIAHHPLLAGSGDF